MIIKENEDLALHTTVRIGGTAQKYIIPENLVELMSVMDSKTDIVLGGGSNLLIAEHDYNKVIDLSRFNLQIQNFGDGKYKIGASVRLQSVIKTINEDNRGGIEYLMSVPGLIGGAVTMNAGRGKKYGMSISDYIVSVEALIDGEIKTFSKKECQFSYRDSIFKNSNMIVTSVIFEFPQVPFSESEKLKRERIELCRKMQDNTAPNFGSVFMECNPKIMKCVKAIGIKKNKVHFSKKTGNWIVNKGGTYEDALYCIKSVEFIHHIFKKKCIREVIVKE